MKLDNVITVRNGKTIYKFENKLIKLFDLNYKKSDILNEALNQSRAEEASVNVPKILEINMIDGKWAIVMEYINGTTLDKLMEEHPEKVDEYLDLFTDLQIEMHKFKAPLLNKLKDKMDRKINESGLDASTRYELHTRLGGMPKHTKLCHGDFNPSNIIINDKGEYYIIDWSHATQGNAGADVARTYLLFMLNNSEKLAEKYLDMFCKKSDTAKQYVNKWLPIIAASQLSKGKKEEREVLMKWLNVVEFE